MKHRRKPAAGKCEECGRPIDGLTDDAVRHPIFETLCVGCGDAFASDGNWSPAAQQDREKSVYGIPKKKR